MKKVPRVKRMLHEVETHIGKSVFQDYSDGVIDCFGGSGRTGQAVIDLNQADRMNRRYVQVKVNQYFDTLLRPRIPKAAYSSLWNGETQFVNVDRVETFNWLLGMTVKHIDVIRGVRVVEGTTSDGDRPLVLWRNLDETDHNALDEWFKKQDYNTRDQEYGQIYVNGDNNLENLRRGD